jgi:hypothetical protein
LKKIHILYTYANTQELGGADFCLLKLAAGLDRSIFEIHVAFGRYCPLADKYRDAGIHVHYGPMARLQKTKNPIKILGYFFRSFSTIPGWLN